MATVKCPLIANGWKRGYPSCEWNDGEKDRIYCMGWIDPMYDEPLQECKDCPDHVDKAEDDRAKFYGEVTE